PKSTQVARSFQSEIRVRSSAPITSTFFAVPPRRKLSAMESAYREPAHAALTSKQTAFFAPIFACTSAAAEGNGMSGVTVPTTIMSSSAGAIPAISSALCEAAVAMSLVASSGAAMRRAPIPVRSRIQASLVLMPNSFTRSSFVPLRDHRDPLDAEQGSAAHLLVIDTLLHLFQLRFDQKSAGARHPAGLDLALEELSECPDGALRRLQQHVAGEPVGRDHVEQSG